MPPTTPPTPQRVPAGQPCGDEKAGATSELFSGRAARKAIKHVLVKTTELFGTGKDSAPKGLYTTKDLIPFARLGCCGVPVVVSIERRRFERIENDSEFIARVRAIDPAIADLPLASLKMVLAGGAVSAHVMAPQLARRSAYGAQRSDRNDYDDYDLFLVGHTADSAREAVKALHAYLVGLERSAKPGPCQDSVGKTMVYATTGCVTIILERLALKVQVVLKLYDSVAEILNGFDLGSSSVAWDGTQLLFTEAGLFAANHGANLATLVSRRGSYEARIAKYFSRGFDLVLPGLNLISLKDCGYCLPYLKLFPNSREESCEGCRCQLVCHSLSPEFPAGSQPASPTETIAALYTGGISYGSLRAIRDKNLRMAMKGKAAGLCGYAVYSPSLDYAELPVEYPASTDVSREIHELMQSGTIRIDRAIKTLGVELAGELARSYISQVAPLLGNSESFEAKRQIAGAIAQKVLELRTKLPESLELVISKAGGHSGAGMPAPTWYGAAYSLTFLDSIDPKLSWRDRKNRTDEFAAGKDLTVSGLFG